VIVVIGQPYLRETEQGPALDGSAARIAFAAAERGRDVQLVGTAGEDEAGNDVVLALARAGVGHVALLRKVGQETPLVIQEPMEPAEESSDPGGDPRDRALEGGALLDAGDIELALRYLTDFSVLVLAVPADREIARVVTAAAGWGDARLILVVPTGDAIPDGLPADAIVFEAPETDPDGVFAEMVGSFAAALDDGTEPAVAFRASVEGAGWTPAPTD
jgi:hypothetical protein